MLEREQTHKSSKQIILCQPPRVLLLPHNHIPYSLLHLLPEVGEIGPIMHNQGFVAKNKVSNGR